MLIKYKGEDCFSFIVGKTYEARKIHDELGDGYAIFDEGDDWYGYDVCFVEENFDVVEDEQEVRRAV
ncbi:MAG: hypothetical protein IJK81_07440 [Selenomonadaceae bacterium]|nr:hypothetical protein [Selenomonadaceae bacterium]